MAIRNILAVRNDRFGEFLLNIPAFRALKETFAGSRLVLVVHPDVEDLARCIPFVDDVMVWQNKTHDFLGLLKFSKRLRLDRFDACIILNPSKEFHIISFLAGIPVRVGYARKLGFLLTHKIHDKKYIGDRHEVEYNLELVSLLGAKTRDKSCVLNIDDSLLSGLENKLGIDWSRQLVVIHPWTSDVSKQWSVEKFFELARKLLKEPNLQVIIIGASDEKGRSLEFESLEGLVNLTGKTTLKELAAILKRCKLLITGDSGPAHLSCSMGTPVIAIFRNDLPAKGPKRWGPYLEGSIVIEKPDLSAITLDEVYKKIKEKLHI